MPSAKRGLVRENEAKTSSSAAAPRKRDMTRSREAILKTAIKHFVEKGYDGARVDEIVSDTDTSKNLVYHYFGSKEDLYVAALERIYEEFSLRRGNAWRDEKSPVEGLRKLARETFNALIEMPEIVSLLNTENLFKAVHIKKLPRIKAIYQPLLDDIRELLIRGEKAGVFRKGIDPVQFYISMSAISYHYISNQHTFFEILGFDLMAPRRIKSRRDHVIEMCLRFCLEPSAAAQHADSGLASQ
jgi:TetR/AcrR family transcriptional regulator